MLCLSQAKPLCQQVPGYQAKKPVVVLTNSVSITEANKEVNPETPKESELKQVPRIHYLTQFSKFSTKALINLSSKVNIM